MSKIKKLINFLSVTGIILFSSCLGDVEDITPKFKNGIETITKQVTREISFGRLSLQSNKKEETGMRTSRELDIVLTDAAIKSYNGNKLDSLTNKIVSIVKKDVTNIGTFDWINVLYETTDGSKASDSTDRFVYVFRPNEIR